MTAVDSPPGTSELVEVGRMLRRAGYTGDRITHRYARFGVPLQGGTVRAWLSTLDEDELRYIKDCLAQDSRTAGNEIRAKHLLEVLRALIPDDSRPNRAARLLVLGAEFSDLMRDLESSYIRLSTTEQSPSQLRRTTSNARELLQENRINTLHRYDPLCEIATAILVVIAWMFGERGIRATAEALHNACMTANW